MRQCGQTSPAPIGLPQPAHRATSSVGAAVSADNTLRELSFKEPPKSQHSPALTYGDLAECNGCNGNAGNSQDSARVRSICALRSPARAGRGLPAFVFHLQAGETSCIIDRKSVV